MTSVPDVSGLRRDTIDDGRGVPYLERFHVVYSKAMSVRFHHFLSSDPDPDLHDHPWDYATYLLSGSYTEVTPSGVAVYEAPVLLTHQAEDLHRVELVPGETVWTLFVAGPVRRRWGFQTAAGWEPWRDYRGAVGPHRTQSRRW